MKQEIKEEFKELTLNFFKKHKLKFSDILALAELIKFWTYKKLESSLDGYK